MMSHVTWCSSQNLSKNYGNKTIAQKVDSVLQLMTLVHAVYWRQLQRCKRGFIQRGKIKNIIIPFANCQVHIPQADS